MGNVTLKDKINMKKKKNLCLNTKATIPDRKRVSYSKILLQKKDKNQKQMAGIPVVRAKLACTIVPLRLRSFISQRRLLYI